MGCRCPSHRAAPPSKASRLGFLYEYCHCRWHCRVIFADVCQARDCCTLLRCYDCSRLFRARSVRLQRLRFCMSRTNLTLRDRCRRPKGFHRQRIRARTAAAKAAAAAGGNGAGTAAAANTPAGSRPPALVNRAAVRSDDGAAGGGDAAASDVAAAEWRDLDVPQFHQVCACRSGQTPHETVSHEGQRCLVLRCHTRHGQLL